MRDLDDLDPRKMTYPELLRAVAEAAAHVVNIAPHTIDSKPARDTYNQWIQRQALLERVLGERIG